MAQNFNTFKENVIDCGCFCSRKKEFGDQTLLGIAPKIERGTLELACGALNRKFFQNPEYSSTSARINAANPGKTKTRPILSV